MKHKVLITPLNCAFSTGLNAVLRMEESEYAADTTRSIYCKSPDQSWFKMKSGSLTPYLEPAFYGLKPGDVITVEFDALLYSGQGGFTVNFISILSTYATGTTLGQELPDGSLTSYYKHFKIEFMVRENYASGIAVLLNFRPTGTNNEVLVKNIEVGIETSNGDFSIANQAVCYNGRSDFMKCIDFYSGTNLNSGYNTLLSVFNSGHVSFPDDSTIQFSNAGIVNFKGLMGLFNGHKYRASYAVYAEYISPQTPLSITAKGISEAGVMSGDDGGGASMPLTTTIKKSIRYFVSTTTPTRKNFIDIGMVASGSELTLRNVRLSMPQFDDSFKRQPNQLEELYTNLSAKIR